MRPWISFFAPTGRFLLRTEIHAYAFAIAASVLLSFFPFLVLILSVSQHLLHWHGASDVIYMALRDFLPSDPQLFDFVRSNLRAAVASRGRAELFSIILLLFTSNGIFEPLEVALNRIWGIPKNRSYWRNQWISFGLTLLCGVLAVASTMLTLANRSLLESLAGTLPSFTQWAGLAAFKAAALPASIAALFLVYWLLPNGPVPWRPALGGAVLSGIAVEVVKILYIRVWPWLDFRHVYGPFFISVTLVLWGVIASLVVLAGAEIAVRQHRGVAAAPARRRSGILSLDLGAREARKTAEPAAARTAAAPAAAQGPASRAAGDAGSEMGPANQAPPVDRQAGETRAPDARAGD